MNNRREKHIKRKEPNRNRGPVYHSLYYIPYRKAIRGGIVVCSHTIVAEDKFINMIMNVERRAEIIYTVRSPQNTHATTTVHTTRATGFSLFVLHTHGQTYTHARRSTCKKL